VQCSVLSRPRSTGGINLILIQGRKSGCKSLLNEVIEMDDPRCKIAAIEMDDHRCSGLLNGMVVQMEDFRCKSLHYRATNEMEDPRCGGNATEMDDPRCRGLSRAW